MFYQLANRVAHLYFLRTRGVQVWLLLVNFTGDEVMGGPASQAEWEAACRVVWHVLGVSPRHALAKYIIHAYPNVDVFAD
jgi:hypothetical protein